MKTKLILSVLILGFLFSCSPSQNELIPIEQPVINLPAATLLDQSYGPNDKQTYDLYLPANRSDALTKTIVLVHGGGWIAGDKADMNYLIPILRINFPDYAIANINYRLAVPRLIYAFPMQNDDMTAVLNKLKNDQNDISDNFGYIGTSAGAHLSMLQAYSNNTGGSIKIVVSIVGPTNFTDPNYANNPAWVTNYLDLTGLNYSSNVPYFENLSPFHKATNIAPPTLLLYGNADPLIPNTQHLDLHNKLNQLSVFNEYKVYNGGHGNWSEPDKTDAANKIINFIRTRF